MSDIDARIVKTKKFLQSSLITLMENKKLSEIKICDLCKEAEVNRATFYFHYKTIYDLFQEILNDFMNSIFSHIADIYNSSDSYERGQNFISLIDYIEDNSSIFMILFENANGNNEISEQYALLKEQIPAHLNLPTISKQYTNYLTNFLIYSGGSVLYTWIKNGKKESKQEVAKILHGFTTKGVSSLIKNEK